MTFLVDQSGKLFTKHKCTMRDIIVNREANEPAQKRFERIEYIFIAIETFCKG